MRWKRHTAATVASPGDGDGEQDERQSDEKTENGQMMDLPSGTSSRPLSVAMFAVVVMRNLDPSVA